MFSWLGNQSKNVLWSMVAGISLYGFLALVVRLITSKLQLTDEIPMWGAVFTSITASLIVLFYRNTHRPQIIGRLVTRLNIRWLN